MTNLEQSRIEWLVRLVLPNAEFIYKDDADSKTTVIINRLVLPHALPVEDDKGMHASGGTGF